MAVESAALTNNWADAQHLEVIPVRHGGLAPPSIMLQAQRHTRQVEKATGKQPWRRNTNWWGGAATPPRGEGEKKVAKKGKGDGRGKGLGRGGKGKGRGGAWKDKEKPEGPEAGAGK